MARQLRAFVHRSRAIKVGPASKLNLPQLVFLGQVEDKGGDQPDGLVGVEALIGALGFQRSFLYTLIRQATAKGWIEVREGPSLPGRGGKPRLYRITAEGAKARIDWAYYLFPDLMP